MKKWLKITLGVIGGIILFIIMDLICIFTIHRPIFAIKKENGTIYKGILYDTYICEEYSVPQIKVKGVKFICNVDTNKEQINEVAEISLGENAWINSLTKVNIEGTNDYFEITKKVKWEIPEHLEDTTISFSIPIPYTFVVNGVSYHGIYELNDASSSKVPDGLDYNLRVINLTKDGKIEVEVTK